MKYLTFLFLFFFNFNAAALTLKQALEFERALKEGACSQVIFKELTETELKEPFLLLYSEDCLRRGNYSLAAKAKGVKNLYGKLNVALSLRKVGRKGEAEEIFKEVFSFADAPSEDILSLNLKDSSFLFEPKVLRKKVWLLASQRNTDEALFYLSYLRGDPYYFYLLGYTYMKAGRRDTAESFFKLSSVPKRFFYLLFLSKEPVEKLNYFKQLLDSPVPLAVKRRASVYLLDYLFMKDLGLFRRALSLVSDRKGLKDIYTYFKDRYSIFTKGCKAKISNSVPQRWWKVACSGRGELPKGINFYSLMLNPPKKFPFDKEEVFKSFKLTDPGLNYLYSKGYCQVLTLIEEKTPQTALLMNLCGDYRKGIKFASPFRGKIGRYPYLLAVLYPKPPLFKDDLISLSIARQESLFEPRALSRSGARGLMQIMPLTGKYIAKKLKREKYDKSMLFDPELNYRFGSYYIHSLLKKFKLFPLAAAGYNGGPARVSKALKLFGKIKTPSDLVIFTDVYLPFAETRDYVKRTAVNLYFYSNLYGEGEEWRTFLRP